MNRHWLSISLLLLLLTACGQPLQPPAAAPGGNIEIQTATALFFSEYIEGSSNSKALEIYNGMGSEVDLSAGGYNVQMYFNGSTSAGLTINLNGMLANGDVFVLAHSSADPAILGVADQTNSSGWFNGDDAVVLRKGTTVLDVIGQVGYDPGTEWGTGLTSTADNTLRRKNAVCAGDTDGSNVFDPGAEWDGFAINTFDGLGSHQAACVDAAPVVTRTMPADGVTDVALDSAITITFSEPVDVAEGWFELTCTLSEGITATAEEDAATFMLVPDRAFAQGESCTVTIVAEKVTDKDGTPQPMVEGYSFTFDTFTDAVTITRIHTIQGDNATSTLVGDSVVVEAVVTSTAAGLGGFYLQEELQDWDEDPNTSEGVFVFVGSGRVAELETLNRGDLVRVEGVVGEYRTSGGASFQTQIAGNPTITKRDDAPVTIEPVDLTFPLNNVSDLEAFEGMLVRFPQELVISEYFNFDRFGEIVLVMPLDGLERHYTPTSIVEPGPAANALAQEYELRRITMDDGRSSQNPLPAIHPDGSIFDVTNRFRGGDTITNVVGVIDHTFGLYRLQPVEYGDYTQKNPRPVEPEDVGGRLKVASFNVLNYFLTLDTGPDICGPARNLDCRGANNMEEFERQRAKILAALAAIDAGVVGLIELENTTGVEPMADLVAGLNAVFGAGTYAFIDTGPIGTDAIKVGFIYKPAIVTPVGDYAVLDSTIDPRFVDTRNRPALAQTFMENTTGARFTAVVNHLKSKGSACAEDPDAGDGQGNCNQVRTDAARALADWLDSDPTGSDNPDFLIIGDLNAYAMEEPIQALERAGYTDLIRTFQGEFAYSYVFNGQFGYLDHALANASLIPQVSGVTEWHINADEPDILDYDMTFNHPSFYEPTAFRSSDHDPVAVGLELSVDPLVALELLKEQVERLAADGILNRGQHRSLLAKLDQVQRSLNDGKAHVAVNQLDAFMNQVTDFVHDGILSSKQGADLAERAQLIKNALR